MGESDKNKNQKKFFEGYLPKHQLLILVGVLLIGGILSWIFIGYASANTIEAFSEELDKYSEEKEQEQDDEIVTIRRNLMGQILYDDEEVPYPFAVMIENLPSVRPQSGLQGASIVYEALVEGLATRFMAVFDTDGLDEIGPVRSARPYYTQWVSEYDALYAHCGGSPEALTNVRNWELNSINQIGGDWPYYWRDSSKYAPHNLYTSSELITKAMRDKELADREPSYETWIFKDDAALDNRPTEEKSIKIAFSGLSWEVEYKYDQEQNNYVRYNSGLEHKDTQTNEAIRVKNVVVQVIPEIVAFGELGRLTLEIEGEGEAKICRDGSCLVGTWRKSGRTNRTVFYDADGREIEFNVGNTWISVAPMGYETVEYN
ncbi:MAG: DUF3048 domain-containing protein [Patescibacteria group bacterium]